MKRSLHVLLLLATLFVCACSGAQSEVKKSWRNTVNTLRIEDLTKEGNDFLDASTRLHAALDQSIQKTGFLVTGKEAKFKLKYKIIEYQPGSRMGRLATFGAASSAHARLEVKVALYDQDKMVGGWVVNSWLKGGWTGGSEEKLFIKAAEEIAGHLRGDF